MEYSKTEVKNMREDVLEALQKVAEQYNSKIELGSTQYGLEMKTSLRFLRKTSDQYGETVLSKEAIRLKRMISTLGLHDNVINEPFVYRGYTIVITGYSARAKKYPILFTKNNKKYKCTVAQMKEMVKIVHPEYFL